MYSLANHVPAALASCTSFFICGQQVGWVAGHHVSIPSPWDLTVLETHHLNVLFNLKVDQGRSCQQVQSAS